MRALVAAAARVAPEVTDEAGLAAAYHAGSEPVRALAGSAAGHIGRAIAGLIGALNVRHVLIIGPVAQLGGEWLEQVRAAARAASLPLLARDTLVDFGHVSDDIVVLGASAMVMDAELGLSLAR